MSLFIDNDKDRIIDIVMCIDLTAGAPFIGEVKRGAPTLYDRLVDGFREQSDFFEGGYDIRIRFVGYRDYSVDYDPMVESPFYTLNTEEGRAEMIAFLAGLDAHGGGDLPESGLEALAHAMRSDWRPYESFARRIIVLWTNSLTHPLGVGSGSENYPERMPKSMEELRDLWLSEVGNKGARLFILAPESDPVWSDIVFWPRVYTTNIPCGGSGDVDLDGLIDIITTLAR